MTWQEFKEKRPKEFDLWVEVLRQINEAGFAFWALEDWDYDPAQMRIYAKPSTKCSIYYVYYGEPDPAWVERE
jgi:hypothetical protein